MNILPSLQDLLSKTAVFKLNGGLGTSMGLEKAKSLLEVKEGKTFLDLIAEQVKYTRSKYDSKVSCSFEGLPFPKANKWVWSLLSISI